MMRYSQWAGIRRLLSDLLEFAFFEPQAAPNANSDQGVGPHYDAGFLTLLLPVSPHEGLQVQTPSGAWVPAPPLPDTLVVNFGKGIEAATRGLAKAMSHRVLSPTAGSTPRHSVPFFQRI